MEKLPVELIFEIFLSLEPDDIAVIPLVCRTWRNFCSESLWKSLFIKRFGTTSFTPCHRPFTWQKECILRTKSLQAWNKTRIPAVSYRPSTRTSLHLISHCQVNWDQGVLLAADDDSASICALTLSTGAWHRNSKSFWVREWATRATTTVTSKFGILMGFQDGSACYSGIGVPIFWTTYENTSPIACAWLSESEKPNKRAHLPTFALGTESGWAIFFTTPNEVFGTVTLDGPIRQISCIDKHFAVLTDKSLWLIKMGTEPILICAATNAEKIYTSYPFVVIIIEQEIKRINVETRHTDVFIETDRPSVVSADGTLICAYFQEANAAMLWAIGDRSDMGIIPPLWIRYDILKESSDDWEHGRITQIAISPVVVAFGGFAGNFRVLDVLTGATLAPKSTRLSARLLPLQEGETPFENGRTVNMHISPSLAPSMVQTIGPVVTVYGTERPPVKPRNVFRRKERDVQFSEEDFEEENDYHTRRINRENMLGTGGMTEEEQTTLAVAMSETHTPELSEQEQLRIAIEQSHSSANSGEDEELQRALKISLSSIENETINDDCEDDHELRKALELSLQEQ